LSLDTSTISKSNDLLSYTQLGMYSCKYTSECYIV